ncbi:MAG TPA: S8 family serine peptidase [Thermoanaerobaculia bacterium]|nr:S8 family serine peptidase [Thermoanaerobaculia bacterium]
MTARFRLTSFALALALSLTASAEEPLRGRSANAVSHGGERYYLGTAVRPLLERERAGLDARGIRVIRPAAGGRYVVRAAAGVAASGLLEILEPITPEMKIQSSARREAGRGSAFARLKVLFHDDVGFEAATATITALGGSRLHPFDVDFRTLRSLDVWLPSDRLQRLAEQNGVMMIGARVGEIRSDNTKAALLSNVDSIQAPPHNLTGEGVIASVLDCGSAQANHPEFTGRLTSNSGTGAVSHPTHVSGTIGAAGVRADAKGMAPRVRIQQFDLNCPAGDFEPIKRDSLGRLGVHADNNSWSFTLGWSLRSAGSWAFFINTEFFGAYSPFESAVLDRLSSESGTLIVFSSGNENDDTGPTQPPFSHTHDGGSTTFCVSQNGSGTDCPVSPSCQQCEINGHPPDGPFMTIGPTGSAKNIIAVGAVNASKTIADFSSRGPTRDGRIKPEIVARGVSLLSSTTNGSYTSLSGTSMAAPVVTGTAALLVEQWRRTMGGDPSVEMLRALLINGAEDLGEPGPDYTYGFGLLDARSSVDLIIGDGGTRSMIRSGTVSQGETLTYPFVLGTDYDARVTLAWTDPDVALFDMASKALVNDLDLIVRDPSGNEIFPFVLDPSRPAEPATRGINSRDNVEQVEILDSIAGLYTVEVKGSMITGGEAQPFALVTNPRFRGVACADSYEPNDTEGTAYGNLPSGRTIQARICSDVDVDHYRIVPDRSGPVVVTVAAGERPLRVTLTREGAAPLSTVIAASTSGSVQTTLGVESDLPISPTPMLIRVEPAGGAGESTYTLEATFGNSDPVRRRSVSRH